MKFRTQPGLHSLLLCLILHPRISNEDVVLVAHTIQRDVPFISLALFKRLIRKYDMGVRHFSRFGISDTTAFINLTSIKSNGNQNQETPGQRAGSSVNSPGATR